ncbi:uracil-DNA glycosylase family protein [candidate division KSB1 bacterium]
MPLTSDQQELFRRYFLQQSELYGGQFWSSREGLKLQPAEKSQELPDVSGPYVMHERTGPVKEPPHDEPPYFAGGDNPELRALYHSIKDCAACSLGKTRTNFVFGVGNPNADILFIGEAPGADEDRTGIPFVGRAGKLLDKLLAEVGLDRKKVFIGNILKCRPPQNRDPNPLEAATCIPYLENQIELIRPKIIVALGRIAAQTLLQTTTAIGKLRGIVHQYRGTDMIATYHPAALLRSGRFMDPTRQDFQRIVNLYREK